MRSSRDGTVVHLPRILWVRPSHVIRRITGLHAQPVNMTTRFCTYGDIIIGSCNHRRSEVRYRGTDPMHRIDRNSPQQPHNPRGNHAGHPQRPPGTPSTKPVSVCRTLLRRADRVAPWRAAVRVRRRRCPVSRLLRRDRDRIQRLCDPRDQRTDQATGGSDLPFLHPVPDPLADRAGRADPGDDPGAAGQGALRQQRHRSERGGLPRDDAQPEFERVNRAAALVSRTIVRNHQRERAARLAFDDALAAPGALRAESVLLPLSVGARIPVVRPEVRGRHRRHHRDEHQRPASGLHRRTDPGGGRIHHAATRVLRPRAGNPGPVWRAVHRRRGANGMGADGSRRLRLPGVRGRTRCRGVCEGAGERSADRWADRNRRTGIVDPVAQSVDLRRESDRDDRRPVEPQLHRDQQSAAERAGDRRVPQGATLGASGPPRHDWRCARHGPDGWDRTGP